MHCKDCRFYEHGNIVFRGTCLNREKLGERLTDDDALSYPYEEGGWFEPGPLFGCIHFIEKH